MKLNRFILIQFILLLAACETKTPTCSSGKVIKLVSASIAENLIEIGVVNYKIDDLSKLIIIDSIQTTVIDEKLDSYDCNANVAIKYPTGLADNIYTSYSTEKGREDVLQRLKIKYGEVSGFLIHGEMIAMLSISAIGAVFNGMLLPNEGSDNSIPLKAILKNFLDEKRSFSYKVFSIQNNQDTNFKIKWEFEDTADMAIIELFFNISRVYESESA